MESEVRTSYHVCPLCEATCGLEIHTREREVTGIRGDQADVFSHGFICPKAYALKELDADPDRLRAPLVRRDGVLAPATWDEAFAEIDRRLGAILREHGRDAVAVYLGNPSAHSMAIGLYAQVLLRALGTRNIYSASTVDQMPKQVSAGLMFGTVLSIPVPDIDHTDYLLILGANPFVSNGSLMTAPDVPGRLPRELAGARCAAVYARIGTCTQEFGTLASWLVDVVNVLTGQLDRVGGAMFTKPATGSGNTRGTPGRGKGVRFGRRASRVRGA